MKRPALKNKIAITCEESKALSRLFALELEQGIGVESYKESLKEVVMYLKGNKSFCVDYVEMPHALSGFYTWNYQKYQEQLDEKSYLLLEGFYKKIRPLQLVAMKTSVVVRKTLSGKNYVDLLACVNEAFNLDDAEQECFHKDHNECFTVYYPSAVQAQRLCNQLTNYLMSHPCAPMYFQTLRKQAYKVAEFLSELHERYVFAEESHKERIFYDYHGE